jgi:hypothetical protein
MTPEPQHVAECRAWADIYRKAGFNPLPSAMDAKKPLVKYADRWDEPFPKEEFDGFETSNLQVMTGRHWGLLVIDLDGEPAVDWWRRMAGGLPRTWITHSSGAGRHLWFSVPQDHPRPLPKAVLWRGEGKHEAVERLCDRSLIMAPPSWHPTKEGVRYRFLAGHSPREVPAPAPCPRRLLELKPVDPPRVAPAAPAPRRVILPASGSRYDIETVLDAIPDKVALAREWGVRLAGPARSSGWVPCHAVDREDRVPSAAIHRESGGYHDSGSGLNLSLLKLSLHLGIYPDIQTAITHLGDRYVYNRKRHTA